LTISLATFTFAAIIRFNDTSVFYLSEPGRLKSASLLFPAPFGTCVELPAFIYCSEGGFHHQLIDANVGCIRFLRGPKTLDLEIKNNGLAKLYKAGVKKQVRLLFRQPDSAFVSVYKTLQIGHCLWHLGCIARAFVFYVVMFDGRLAGCFQNTRDVKLPRAQRHIIFNRCSA
jgi:hypothetical protein